jgi:hypothetical protein
MQEKFRIVGKEEGIKGLGRKETKSGMNRNGKLEKNTHVLSTIVQMLDVITSYRSSCKRVILL